MDMDMNTHNDIGRVFGVILNDKGSLEYLQGALHQAPYNGAPKHPILYIKPRSTYLKSDSTVVLPENTPTLSIGATLALRFNRKVTQVKAQNALSMIKDIRLVADLSIPHGSYYRPAIAEKCFDHSLIIGTGKIFLEGEIIKLVHQMKISIFKNNELLATVGFDDLVRDIPTLLADITEFMSFDENDILLLKMPYVLPEAAANDVILIKEPTLGEISFIPVTFEDSVLLTAHPQPNHLSYCSHSVHSHKGRVAYNGQILEAYLKHIDQNNSEKTEIQLSSGEIVKETDVVWLPPVQVNTIFTLGLNYADHAKELAFSAPEKPLVFLKSSNTILGHRAKTVRPDNVAYMHYECELAVIIGKSGKHIPESEAMDYVEGYTIANDYAIRDYLENYYRPNLKVKNRDGATPLGPWLVDKSYIPDPMNLNLRTFVNGVKTQEGNTSDMVFSISKLISYLSNIMTLMPGDVILTGTPKGLADVKVGDVVICEIEGIGRLVNTIKAPEIFA